MTAPASLHALPDATEYAAAARRRSAGLAAGAVALSLATGYAFNKMLYGVPPAPLVLLLSVMMPILLWRFGRLNLWLLVVASCLFELQLVAAPDGDPYPDALTDRVPFFWNINTIFQVYGHVNFKGVPLNLFEVLMLLAGICSFLRSVYTRTAGVRGGLLLVPIGAYMLFVLAGWVNGVATGGDFKISLQEVRSQLYFGLAYLLAVNMVRERKHLLTLLNICVACIGLKAILLCIRRFVTMNGQVLSDQGVGAHEEAFFFDAFGLLLLTLVLCRALPRLRRAMWWLLPFVTVANLALNRRAATAALIILLPILVAAACQAVPDRRRFLAGLMVSLTLAVSIYYPLFKNKTGTLAQPARAIQSNFVPDARDASSNAARDAENANLMATIKTAPLQGYGYGRRFYHVFPMADISKIYALEDYLPHNQILWVWERVGSFGFVVFWLMISAIIILAGQTLRAPQADGLTRAVGIFVMLLVTMLLIFGLLDLQLSNFRNVLFVGVWVGVLASLASGLREQKEALPQDGGPGA